MQSSHGKMDKSGKCFAKKNSNLPTFLKCIMPSMRMMMMQGLYNPSATKSYLPISTIIFRRKFEKYMGTFFLKGQKSRLGFRIYTM